VGDLVEAKIKVSENFPTGWAKGTILKQWNDGNPYRIKIEKTGMEVRFFLLPDLSYNT